MRIRSIKPEFWRSKDIVSLDWGTRLVFIALWSYVDDNGVGWDDLPSVVGDLFADDLVVDPTETLRRVSLSLDALSDRGLIVRYTVDGKRLLQVTGWDRHQVIKNPSLGHKYPRWSGETQNLSEPLLPLYGDSTETLLPGTGEQGNRGTGEQGSSAPTVRQRSAPRDPDRDDSGAIVGEWIDTLPSRPPGRVIGQVAKEIKTMLDEGIDPDLIRAGVAEWQRKGLHPSALASIVHEVSTPHERGHRNGNDIMADIRRDAYQRTAQQGSALNLIEGGHP